MNASVSQTCASCLDAQTETTVDIFKESGGSQYPICSGCRAGWITCPDDECLRCGDATNGKYRVYLSGTGEPAIGGLCDGCQRTIFEQHATGQKVEQ